MIQTLMKMRIQDRPLENCGSGSYIQNNLFDNFQFLFKESDLKNKNRIKCLAISVSDIRNMNPEMTLWEIADLDQTTEKSVSGSYLLHNIIHHIFSSNNFKKLFSFFLC